jgi:hypothetical protein
MVLGSLRFINFLKFKLKEVFLGVVGNCVARLKVLGH